MLASHKKFISVGTHNLSNREAWLEKSLKEIPAGSKLLDAGAGETKYRKYCSHLQYVSQDFGQYDGTGDSKSFQTKTWDNTKLDIVSDITQIPVGDASFDTILCVEVFEHIPEPIKAVAEFKRILKPNGILLLTVPFCAQTHFAPYFFYSGFSKYWLERALTENNFTNIHIEPNGDYFEYIAQEVRKMHRVITKYVSKNILLFIFYKITALPFVLLLQYLASHQKHSDDMLCYGFNVRATRR